MYCKTLLDIVNAQDMIDRGYMSYISDLLGKGYAIVEEVESKMNLEEYLDSVVGKKLFKEEQKELIETINVRVNGRMQRSYRKLNEGLEMIKLSYVILPKKSGNTRYWIVEKIDRC